MSKQQLSLEPVGGCCVPIMDAALDSAAAVDGASVFKALADPIRLRVMSIIASAGGEVCVCDLTPQFDVSGPTISHHLKVLREAGLVDCERRGTWVYYWALPERLTWMSTLLSVPAPAAS
jgi:ArsR family transcriptional regulator, arsenate/arsenite/antimonite-responsive transcriptional repressor